MFVLLCSVLFMPGVHFMCICVYVPFCKTIFIIHHQHPNVLHLHFALYNHPFILLYTLLQIIPVLLHHIYLTNVVTSLILHAKHDELINHDAVVAGGND